MCSGAGERAGLHDQVLLADRTVLEEYLIVQGGALAGTGARSYSAGDATGGSGDAARFRAG